MIRPYNKGVLVGNWYEDRVLEEVGTEIYGVLTTLSDYFLIELLRLPQDVIKDYLERRSNGELTSQKLAARAPQPVSTDCFHYSVVI